MTSKWIDVKFEFTSICNSIMPATKNDKAAMNPPTPIR